MNNLSYFNLLGIGNYTIKGISGPTPSLINNAKFRSFIVFEPVDTKGPLVVASLDSEYSSFISPSEIFDYLDNQQTSVLHRWIESSKCDVAYLHCRDLSSKKVECKFIRYVVRKEEMYRSMSSLIDVCAVTRLFPEIDWGEFMIDTYSNNVVVNRITMLSESDVMSDKFKSNTTPNQKPLTVEDFGKNGDKIVRAKFIGKSRFLIVGQTYNVSYSTSSGRCKVRKCDNPGRSSNGGVRFNLSSFVKE